MLKIFELIGRYFILMANWVITTGRASFRLALYCRL